MHITDRRDRHDSLAVRLNHETLICLLAAFVTMRPRAIPGQARNIPLYPPLIAGRSLWHADCPHTATIPAIPGWTQPAHSTAEQHGSRVRLASEEQIA
jgi:hypothetical protein